MDEPTFDAICADIAAGEPAYKASQAHGIPHPTFWRFVSKDTAAMDKYARAKMQGLDRMAEEMLEIADDESLPSDSRRVRVDPRKWLLSKLAPKKYGDKLELGSDPNSPLVVKLLPKDEAA